jgi:DNA-binding protein Alba
MPWQDTGIHAEMMPFSFLSFFYRVRTMMNKNKNKNGKVPAKENAVTPEISPRKEENLVIVGGKPITTYVVIGMVKKAITIKARGKNIPRAIGVANCLRDRLISTVKSVEIGYETHEGRRVSTITIVME